MGEEDQTDTIKDKYFITYLLFYSLGVVTIIPSNFFMTATDYWMYKFRDPTLSYSPQNRTGLQAEFFADFHITTSVSNVVFIILTLLLMMKIGVVKRVIAGLGGVIFMFIITCVFVQVDTDTWQFGFFIVTLVTGSLLTGFCSMFLFTLITLVARFPPRYFGAILTGQSICGVMAALVQILSLSADVGSITSGFTYFLIGLFFIVLSSIHFLASLKYSAFFKFYLKNEIIEEIPKINKELVLGLLNKVKYYLGSMVVVLGCTTMTHPGVTSLVVSVDEGNGNKWNETFFVPTVTFLIYNISEYIGRELASYLKKPSNGLIILIVSCLRVALVPMLMLCNAQPRSHLSVIFNVDYAYVIFIMIFAFTNGYVVNLCAIRIPMVTNDEERMLAMLFIMVFMYVSMAGFSFLSAVLVKSL